MQLDPIIFDHLQGINWFSNVGKPHPITACVAIKVIWLSDNQAAQAALSSCEWENATLEARNRLTVFLAKNHRTEYVEWNRLVRETKDRLKQILDLPLKRIVGRIGTPEVVANSVQWDLLGAVMEATYQEFSPPIFFSHLLMVYESGHLPCGWSGNWPEGKLLAI